jgi:adenylate cyclase
MMTDAASALILIVDDEPLNVDLLEQELGDLGYRTESAFGGLEALAKVAANPPDLILLDVMMPDLDGITVCRQLKDDPTTHLIPIIIMTALNAIEDRVQGIEAGADDFLTKPVDDRELLARIRTALKTKLATDTAADELAAVERDQEKSEAVLRKVLPDNITRRLKEGEETITDSYEEVTVLFSDIVGFTAISHERSSGEIVAALGQVFLRFDELVDFHGLEKIKTLGDGYMVVGGASKPLSNHTHATALLALAMLEASEGLDLAEDLDLTMRFGIHIGPVVAGVLGSDRFTYDVWGDAVNIASRMESHSLPGRIQVSEPVYNKLRDEFRFESRGTIEVKGIGPMNTYFLTFPNDDA